MEKGFTPKRIKQETNKKKEKKKKNPSYSKYVRMYIARRVQLGTYLKNTWNFLKQNYFHCTFFKKPSVSDIVRSLICGRILCENLDDPSAQVFQIKVPRPEEDNNVQCLQP